MIQKWKQKIETQKKNTYFCFWQGVELITDIIPIYFMIQADT